MHSLYSSFNKFFVFVVLVLVLAGTGLILFNIIPLTLAVALFIWLLIKLIKYVKAFAGKFRLVILKDLEEVVLDKDEFDMSDKNVIDVEYKEL